MNRSTQGALTTSGALGVLFVALKLLGFIRWSWWWVTLPFWWGPAAVATLLLGGLLFYAIPAGFHDMRKAVERRKQAEADAKVLQELERLAEEARKLGAGEVSAQMAAALVVFASEAPEKYRKELVTEYADLRVRGASDQEARLRARWIVAKRKGKL